MKLKWSLSTIVLNNEEQEIIATITFANETDAKFYDTVILFESNYGGIAVIDNTSILVAFSSRSSQNNYCSFSHNIGTIIIASSNYGTITFQSTSIEFINNSINTNENQNITTTTNVIHVNRSTISFEYNSGHFDGLFSLTDASVNFNSGFHVAFF